MSGSRSRAYASAPPAVVRLGHDLDVRRGRERGDDAGAEHGMVVRDDDPDGIAARRHASVVPECGVESGHQTRIAVPRPGAEWIWKPPPSSSACSRMPGNPRPVLWVEASPGRSRGPGRPPPGEGCHPRASTDTRTPAPPPWRVALESSSWSARKNVILTDSGTLAGRCPGAARPGCSSGACGPGPHARPRPRRAAAPAPASAGRPRWRACRASRPGARPRPRPARAVAAGCADRRSARAAHRGASATATASGPGRRGGRR